MNYFLVLEKCAADIFGATPVALTALPFAFGVATIPLTALVARSLIASGPSLAAALLAALNPWLLHQSLNIRSYSMLAALSLVVVLAFLRWTQRPGYRAGSWFGAGALLAVLMHPNGVYPVISIAVVVTAALLQEMRRGRAGARIALRSAASLAIPTSLAGLVSIVAYAPILSQMRKVGAPFHDLPPTELHYLSYVWAQYFARGFWGWPAAALFVFGLWRAVARCSNVRLLLPVVLLAPALLSLQGVSHYPWGYSRYLVFTLPLVLILIGFGIGELRESPRWSLLLAALLAATWTPGVAELFAQKADYPWDAVREYIDSSDLEGRAVITLDTPTHIHLRPLSFAESGAPVLLPLPRLSREEISSGIAGGDSAFLVVQDVVPSCAEEVRTFGKIAVVTLDVNKQRGILHEIRACLVGLVEGSWATNAELEPVYGGIRHMNRLLGIPDPNGMYSDLHQAALSRTPESRWATRAMRTLDADKTTRQWQRKTSKD
jgi:hypothetical protein